MCWTTICGQHLCRPPGERSHLVALALAVGVAVHSMLGLVRLLGFLGLDSNALVTVWLNRDGLAVNETGMCARVLVLEVEGVSGELDTTVGLSLDEESVLVACKSMS